MFLTFWVMYTVYILIKDQTLANIHLVKASWQVSKTECFLFYIIKASYFCFYYSSENNLNFHK